MKRGKDLPKASMVAVGPCLGSYKGFHQESVVYWNTGVCPTSPWWRFTSRNVPQCPVGNSYRNIFRTQTQEKPRMSWMELRAGTHEAPLFAMLCIYSNGGPLGCQSHSHMASIVKPMVTTHALCCTMFHSPGAFVRLGP